MLSSHFCTGINELWHEIWQLAPPSTNENAAERLANAERIATLQRSTNPLREPLLPD